MKNLFFGDSLTSGDNNGGKSYVDYISQSEKIGVSGTTIGEYSVYPVDGYSLLSQIHRYVKEIEEAENIFLEYGINDATAAMTAYTRGACMVIDFVKAVDAIKQINPKARLYLLTVTNAQEAVGEAQARYLNEVYMKPYVAHVNERYKGTEWTMMYSGFVRNVFEPSGIKMFNMFESNEEYDKYLDKDGLHPTDKGYQIIANNIKKELYKEWNVA